MSAPDRIWIDPRNGWGHMRATDKPLWADEVEYIRADISLTECNELAVRIDELIKSGIDKDEEISELKAKLKEVIG
jgi:hypothetical protein